MAHEKSRIVILDNCALSDMKICVELSAFSLSLVEHMYTHHHDPIEQKLESLQEREKHEEIEWDLPGAMERSQEEIAMARSSIQEGRVVQWGCVCVGVCVWERERDEKND